MIQTIQNLNCRNFCPDVLDCDKARQNAEVQFNKVIVPALVNLGQESPGLIPSYVATLRLAGDFAVLAVELENKREDLIRKCKKGPGAEHQLGPVSLGRTVCRSLSEQNSHGRVCE